MDRYYNNPNIESTVGAGIQKNLDRNRAKFLNTHDILAARVVTLKDPYRSGNIGIRITGVHSGINSPDVPAEDVLFAPMIMPFGGGDGYGFFSMPPVGSDVYVTFLDGDLKNPVILGSWQSRKMISKPASQGSANEISSVIASGANYRALATTALDPNSKAFNDAKKVFKDGQLSLASQEAIKGFALGQMKDIIKGQVGQVLGPLTSFVDYDATLDAVLGPPLTAVITGISSSVNTSITAAKITDTVTPLLIQGQAQISSLMTQLSSAFTTVTSGLTTLDGAVKGMPGIIAQGLSTVTSDAATGVLGQPIKDAIASVNPNLQTKMLGYIQSAATKGASEVTSYFGVETSLDAALKVKDLADSVTFGKVTEDEATKALETDTVDWVLSKSSGGETIEVYGPQCPLPYKNQTPGRSLEELGQNLTDNTPLDQEELNSCYLSQDLDTGSNSAINPAPACYIWKSPEGSSVEIDDTGYAENGKGIDNRGVRLTTKKGALVHLVDEKDGECILIRDKNNNYIWIDTVNNKIDIFSNGDMGEKITKNKTTTCVNMTETIEGSQVTTVSKDQKETIDGNKYSNTSLNRIENVGVAGKSTWSITINGDANIHASENVAISAAKEVIVGGGLKAVLASDVEVKLKAPIISIEGGGTSAEWQSPTPIHIWSAVEVHLRAPLINMGAT